VPSVHATTLAPVALRATAQFGGGVSAQVAQIADQKVSDTGPGNIVGQPAVAFTIEIRNQSKNNVSLSTVNVTATYGSGTPASPANSASNSAFKGSVKPGGLAKGTYAFAIPTKDRDRVAVSIWYTQGKPTVVFSGKAG
jgi:hypothetical protein